ncbi:Hypothetical predicted protein [Cloeon dipterum]|uniref:TEP1-F n=1 Tax=Cloeon dipterum TaxID=197152 RepID=A0A8S1DQ43_9INSE|nr:Hypothetical predicted protein [Cloeon dipterum]
MKLLRLILLFVMLWADVPLAVGTEETKFILMAPSVFAVEKTETILLNILDNPKKSNFKIRLLTEENNEERELNAIVLENPDAKLHEIQLSVPTTKSYSGKLELHYDEGKNLSSELLFFTPRYSTFIETDKPFYKPGELVQFRILQTKENFLPITTPALPKVWITNPDGIKTAVWTDVERKNGLVQLDFQLISEPIKGHWTISVRHGKDERVDIQSFEVKEYVLPKFEVTVEPPRDFDLSSGNDFTWKVCAKYTFGGAVQGTVKAVFKPVKYHYGFYWRGESPENETIISQINGTLRKNDGCSEFVLTKENINKDVDGKARVSGVIFNATIEEKGTGETREVIETNYFQKATLDNTHQRQFYRPFIPFRGEFTLKKGNDDPIPHAELELTAEGEDIEGEHKIESIQTDQEGKVYFTILAGISKTEITVKAKCKNSTKNACSELSADQTIYPWVSSSNSHIEINSPHKIAKCGEKLEAEVLFTFGKNIKGSSIDFKYIVESRGNIMKTGVVTAKAEAITPPTLKNVVYKANFTSEESEISVGKFNLDLLAESRFSPELKLIVFYIREDKEIVASSRTFKIQNCFTNKVTSKFTKQSVRPGQSVTLSLGASADSLCALTAVDKAVKLLKKRDTWDAERFFLLNNVNGVKQENYVSWKYEVRKCKKEPSEKPVAPERASTASRRIRYHPRYTMEFGNAKRVFEDSRVLILSTLEHNIKPCHYGNTKEECDECPFGDLFPEVYFTFATTSMPGLAGGAVPVLESVAVPAQASGTFDADRVAVIKEEKVRSFFPETWLWKLEGVSANETKNLLLETPDSITDWVLNTVCVSNTDGVGIAPETSLRVIKPFFMDFTLPYSVKREEILHLKVSLFNQLSRELPVKLTFGSFTGGDLRGKQTFSACLGGFDKLVHTFELDTKVLGKHNISVSAGIDDSLRDCGSGESVSVSDEIIKPILIKPEGIPVEKTRSLFYCSEKKDVQQISWNLELPENIVPGSDRAEVAVIGDLLGPSMEHLDRLVQLPVGCGEQNMVLFVPNIVVLKYLNVSGSAENPRLQEEAVQNMKAGYQRELKYRHDDGSYSAFGKSDESGSMWLTAFVVKSFAQAREFIDVDQDDLKKSTDWILSHQLENGCFRQVGKLFHKAMKGGVSESPVALTAYILIALLKSKSVENDKVFENGLDCLKQSSADTELYTRVISTYALQLISERLNRPASVGNDARKALDDLIKSTTKEGDTDVYWQKDATSLGLNIEMTAYAILTLVKVGGTENLELAFNATRWVSKQRNSNGGFVSTQDTVVALEALAVFASTLPRGNVDLKITVTPEGRDSLNFEVKSANKQILQQKDLGSVPRNLQWTADGEGCGLIQVENYFACYLEYRFNFFYKFQNTVRYNLKKSSEKLDAFNVTSKVSKAKGEKCTDLELEFTLAYNLPDGASNMAVLEVELLSGYKPSTTSLDKLKNKVPTFKRWEFEEGKLQLYFDSIDSTPLSVPIIIAQKVQVENIKPAQVKLYDYYEQEWFARDVRFICSS